MHSLPAALVESKMATMQRKLFWVYQRRTWYEFKRGLSVAHARQPVERAENLEYRNQLSGVCWGAVYFSVESIFLNHPAYCSSIECRMHSTYLLKSYTCYPEILNLVLLYVHIDFVRHNFTFYIPCYYLLLQTASFTARSFGDPPLSKWNLRSFANFYAAQMAVAYRRFEANYQFTRVEGFKKNFSWTVRPMEMGPKGCTETSVRNYHSALRKIPQEGRLLVPLHFNGIIFKPCFHFGSYTAYSYVE